MAFETAQRSFDTTGARLAGNGTASDMGAAINWIEDK